ATDQIGTPRPQGPICDVGAFEKPGGPTGPSVACSITGWDRRHVRAVVVTTVVCGRTSRVTEKATLVIGRPQRASRASMGARTTASIAGGGVTRRVPHDRQTRLRLVLG